MTSRTAVPFTRSEVLTLPPHPDQPNRSWRNWALGRKRPLAVDLFAGCGGLSLGLEDAGYGVVLSVDLDEKAVETHKHNLPGLTLCRDLSEPEQLDRVVNLLDGLPIDLVAGGPPCQPFSRAGRSKIRSLVDEGVRHETDERRDLWKAFLEVVQRVKPRAVMLENVPDMALGDHLVVLRTILRELEELGYDTDARLLDAWRYGVPQHRQRLFILARCDGRPLTWPRDQKPITLRQAIGDLPRLHSTTGEMEMKAGTPRTAFQRKARASMNGHRVVWDHVTRAVRPDDLEAFKLMKAGTRYSELPKELRRYRSDIFNDKYNRLSWDELSRSITAHIAKDGYWYIHPQEHRTLTVREAARIQTFPDHFRFAGTRSHAFRQIGNAVPPALAEAIGAELLAGNKKRKVPASRRASARTARIRRDLLRWATGDARLAPWRHPGDPWASLAGAVLGNRVGDADVEASRFLEEFPRLEKGLSTRIRKAARPLRGARQKAYVRLAKAAQALGAAKGSWTSGSWARAADLGEKDEAIVRMLGLGELHVVGSTAALRVVYRLEGLGHGQVRQRSDGRVESAKLVGAGKDAVSIAASLHAFGRVVCASEPQCTRCPLSKNCLTKGTGI